MATTNQAASALTDEAIEALRERLRDPLLFPCDQGFEKATALRTGMIDKTPALIVPADRHGRCGRRLPRR